jgi:hypothetical protein
MINKKYTVYCPDCSAEVNVEVKHLVGECVTCPDKECGCEFEVTYDGQVVGPDDVLVTCRSCGHEWVEHNPEYCQRVYCPECNDEFDIDCSGEVLDNEDDEEEDYD